MVGITFEASLSFISICSFIIFSSVLFSTTTTATAQELLKNPSNDDGEVFVHPPKHRYIPVLFTGPFNRRSIPLSAAAVAAVATSHEEQQQPAAASYPNRDEENDDSNGYVVQKLFSTTNSNNLQQRNNGAPLYPVVFSRKPNKVWAPHNLRVENHQSFGNAMKQILMRMNYQV
uniref:Uncharacterized protein n=1 Tax=Panagrolaimus superbus TaxID=310955 RepID=A0A914Y2F2_9BILA